MPGLGGVAAKAEGKVAAKAAAKTEAKVAAKAEGQAVSKGEQALNTVGNAIPSGGSGQSNDSSNRFSNFSSEKVQGMHKEQKTNLEYYQEQRALHANDERMAKYYDDQIAASQQNIADLESHMNSMQGDVSSGEQAIAQGEQSIARTEQDFIKMLKEETKGRLKEGAKQHVTNLFKGGVAGGKSGGGLFGGSAGPDLAAQAQEAEQKKQEEQAQIVDVTQKAKDSEQQKLQALKDKEEDKIEKIKSGPHWPIKFFATPMAFLLAVAIDFGISSIPYVGDYISFFVMVFLFWGVPAFFLFDIGLLFKFIFIYAIDTGLSFIPDFVPVWGWLVSMAADLLVETVLFIFIRKQMPHVLVKEAYDRKVPNLVHRVQRDFAIRRKNIQEKTRSKIKSATARIRGQFSGSFAAENRQMIFVVLMILITALGPFGFGIISFEAGMSSFILIGIFVLILIICDVFGMLDNKHFFGILLFIALNMFGTYIIKLGSSLPFLSSGGSAVFTILFLLFTFLYILFTMGYISSKFIAVIIILLIVGLSSFYVIGYLSNPELIEKQKEKAIVEGQVRMENANLIERLVAWAENQYRQGKGDNINNGELEQTHEFASIKIEDIEMLREETIEGQPAIAYIYYSGELPQPTTLRTTCNVEEKIGTTEPEFFDISTSAYPQVKCTIDDLVAGTYQLDVNSYFTYTSSVDVPLRFMSTQAEEQLLIQLKDSSDDRDVQEYTGGVPTMVTNTGPVVIGVSNVKKNDQKQLRLPMITDREDLDRYPLPLRFQLQKSDEDLAGDVEEIIEVVIDLPPAMTISCDGVRDGAQLPLVMQSDGRGVATIRYEDFTIEMADVLSCYLSISPVNVDDYLPAQGWTEHTLKIRATYNYAQKQAAVLEVV